MLFDAAVNVGEPAAEPVALKGRHESTNFLSSERLMPPLKLRPDSMPSSERPQSDIEIRGLCLGIVEDVLELLRAETDILRPRMFVGIAAL